MLSLNLEINLEERKPIGERLLAQAIEANKLSQEEFETIVEVFRERHLSLSNFWNYVMDKKMEYGESAQAVSDAISSVILEVEKFNNLIAKDITWVN